jgi:hypothetical protein
MLVGDNLDLCCQVIEKAAAERAQREIDERLQPSYNARIRAKQAGQQFVDSAQLQGRFPGARRACSGLTLPGEVSALVLAGAVQGHSSLVAQQLGGTLANSLHAVSEVFFLHKPAKCQIVAKSSAACQP